MIPEFSNVYGLLSTRRSKDWITSCFKKAGWSMRKCTWTDYEIDSDYAELIIEGDETILMHGAIADFDSNASSVVAILEENGIGYSIEHYDQAGNLLKILTNIPDSTST